MGVCKDCRWCQTLREEGWLFTTTGYYCVNQPVVQAKGQGKYHHDVKVNPNDSCSLFENRPTMQDINFRRGR